MHIGAINEALRMYRTRAGLTQKAVADELNISRQAYSKYENSDIVPSIERIKQLASLFHVPESAIYGDDNLNTLFEKSGDQHVDKGYLSLANYLRAKDFFVRFTEYTVEISKEMSSVNLSYSEYLEFDYWLAESAFAYIWKRHKNRDTNKKDG